MAVYKVGIIGCGGRGGAHAAGYAASEDAEHGLLTLELLNWQVRLLYFLGCLTIDLKIR